MLLRELAIDTQTPAQGPVGRSVVQGIEVVGPGLYVRLAVGEPGLDQIGGLRGNRDGDLAQGKLGMILDAPEDAPSNRISAACTCVTALLASRIAPGGSSSTSSP